MLRFIVYILMVIFFGGCNAYKITSVYFDKNFDFKRVKTFAWIPDQDTATGSFDNKEVRGAIRHIVTKEIEKRGLTKDLENPDVLIDIVLQNIQITKDQEYKWPVNRNDPIATAYYNIRYGGNPNSTIYYNNSRYYSSTSKTPWVKVIQEVNFVDNSLNVVFFNPANHKVIWTSSSEAKLEDRETMSLSLHPALRKMLSKFPITKINK